MSRIYVPARIGTIFNENIRCVRCENNTSHGLFHKPPLKSTRLVRPRVILNMFKKQTNKHEIDILLG